jgi:hypothetical protein
LYTGPLRSPSRLLALLIVAVALTARLAFLAVHGASVSPDSSEYQLLARNVLRGGTFSLSSQPPLQPAIRRPPVYPLFLAALLPFSASTMVPAVVQAVLDAIVCLLIFLMTSRLVRGPVAVFVSLLYALHPGPIAAAAMLLSETVFTALLCAAVFLMMLAAGRRRPALAFAAGALLGLAALCRSIAVLYVLCVVCVLLTRRFRRMAITLALGAVILIAPWIVRSSLLAGRFVLVQAPSFIDWYLPTLSWIDQNDEPAVWKYFTTVDPYGIRLTRWATPAELMRADDFGRQQAILNLRAGPGAYLRSRIKSYPHLFLNTFDRFSGINRSIGDVFRARAWEALTIKLGLLLVFAALPMLFACLGIRAATRSIQASIAATFWIATLAVHIPMWVEYRYWLPLLPFQLVTAALGIQSVIDRRRSAGQVNHAATPIQMATTPENTEGTGPK